MLVFYTKVFSFLLAFSLLGCTAVDVSKEIGIVEESLTELDSDIRSNDFNKKLADEKEINKEYENLLAAAQNVNVNLSEDCKTYLDRRFGSSLPSCRVIRRETGGLVKNTVDPPDVKRVDIDRKMEILTSYVNALVLLANSKSEVEIANAFAAATDAINKVATEAEISTLSQFAKELADSKPKVDAVVSFAVRAARARKLKTVVLRYDDAVGDLAREIHSKYNAIAPDNEYENALLAMSDADDHAEANYVDLVLARRNKDSAKLPSAIQDYAVAIGELKEAQEKFVEIAPKTVIGRINQIAIAHSALAARLKRPASIEETISFLEEIKALSDTLKED